jgi:3-oxoacyl-[acyl-carrier protein] reductase
MINKFSLTGKNVLVAGSSKGIGFSIAKAFHENGCQVGLNGRNLKDLQDSSNKLTGSIAIQGDVTNPKEAKNIVLDFVDRFKRFDVLICNVGSGKSSNHGNESNDEWKRALDLNLLSATNMIEASRNFLEINHGSIICISSICGLEVVENAPIPYSAAKAALNLYVKAMARPLGKDGIRINAIAPGNILFEDSVWAHKILEDRERTEAMLKSKVSLNTFGDLDDISNLALYLASDFAKFVTGSIWTIDGGQVHS